MPKAPPQIFDTALYARRRARASGEAILAREAAEHLGERLTGFGRAGGNGLDIGSRAESFAALKPFASTWKRTALAAGDERLPASGAFDLVTSVLALHAVNDLPGVLAQIRRALNPGGLFVAALFGGSTLQELRQSFAAAESELRGGASPRVAPFADVRDLGALLQRAGFARPVADTERTVIRYKDINRLFADLRALGETNMLLQRSRKPLPRRVLAATLAHYGDAHAEPDGRLRATFDIVYLTGWGP